MPNAPHYIAMSGTPGCLPEHCQSFNTYMDAVGDLVRLFELGQIRKTRLVDAGFLILGSNDGAGYCEIILCDCDDPAVHNDTEGDNGQE